MMVCIVIAMDGSIDSRQFTMLIQGTQGKQEILDIEMYPLYWTPSKEGTFCVIRLNLS